VISSDPGNASGVVKLERRTPRTLDVAALKRDLAALWQEEGSRGVVTRAAQATLVVASGAEDEGGLLDELLAQYPARGILISTEADRPPGEVDAWVSATCRRNPGGGGLLCSETVYLATGPGSDARIASGIRSLAVGSVPIVVLAPDGDPRDLGWLTHLAGDVEVVAVASGSRGAKSAFGIWSHMARGALPRYSDLLWIRLAGWRRVVARWFDRPGEGSRLAALDRVGVISNGPAGEDPPALLLAGWLGSRLRWDSAGESGGRGRFDWRSEDGPARTSQDTASNGEEDAPGEVLGIDLVFADGGSLLRFRLGANDGTIVVADESARELARYRAERVRPVDWAVAALHDHGGDEVSREAYRFALALAGVR
jgi:glucose-6-phosphate dehydrogenase assembly protein OpcA